MPNIRASARRHGQEATKAHAAGSDGRLKAAESGAVWNWAILELLLKRGLRTEEASDLTPLDILKLRMLHERADDVLHEKKDLFVF